MQNETQSASKSFMEMCTTILRSLLSCNLNTIYTASGKVAHKDYLFWFRASKNCVQQSLSNYSLLIFSSGWTRFILGVESCPKFPGIGHAFCPPGGVKLHQELRVMQRSSGSPLREKAMKNRTKLQMRCRPFWFSARLDTITTLCWKHVDCCNQTFSAI